MKTKEKRSSNEMRLLHDAGFASVSTVTVALNPVVVSSLSQKQFFRSICMLSHFLGQNSTGKWKIKLVKLFLYLPEGIFIW